MFDASDNIAEPLSVPLEENLQCHAIGAENFAPFVIERFRAEDGAAFAEIAVTITDESGRERKQDVRLTWQAQTASAKPFAVQERVVTE